MLARLFSPRTVAGVGLDLALAYIAAKLLRQPVLAAGGFLFAGDVSVQHVGGVRTRAPRFSLLGHGSSHRKSGKSPPWWATLPHPVNTRLRAPKPYGIVRPLSKRRRSSGVERALGKGEVRSSILRGGTISSVRKQQLVIYSRSGKTQAHAEQCRNVSVNWHVSDTRVCRMFCLILCIRPHIPEKPCYFYPRLPYSGCPCTSAAGEIQRLLTGRKENPEQKEKVD